MPAEQVVIGTQTTTAGGYPSWAPTSVSNPLPVTLESGSVVIGDVTVTNLPTTVDTNTGTSTASTLRTVSAAPTAPVTGQTTIAVENTAVQLASNALVVGVIVQALAGNAGNVVIGPSGITSSTGFQLQPGQATSAAVQNTNALYVNGANVGDGVCYIGS